MMSERAGAPPGCLKMEQARRLMDQGLHHESLILALEVLLEELDHLRDSLLALRRMTGSELPALVPDILEEQPEPEFYWLPPLKPRVLH